MTDNSVVATPEAGFWQKTWRLIWPCFKPEEWRSAWALLVVVIGLPLAGTLVRCPR